MQTNAAGRAFITREEGEILHTYYCAAGVATIGVGHTGPDVTPGRRISPAESQALLAADLARFEAAVRAAVKVPLTQNQFNALVSFAFNLGAGALQKSSLLGLVNGNVREAAAITRAFRLWRNVNGHPNAAIEARRQREAALFLTP
jgi:lysozyme